MKPYSDRDNLSPDEIRLNFALSRNRIVIENAFDCLKSCFQYIPKILDTTLEHTVNIVTSCSILPIFA